MAFGILDSLSLSLHISKTKTKKSVYPVRLS